MARHELRVVRDVAAAGVDLFLDARPGTVVLSGGRTPRAMYERLAATEYRWEGVEFFFGDERCVPPDDPRSNVGMANEALLARVPARSYPIDGSTCDADGYEGVLRARFGDRLRFDLVVLGLGPDGHTASLFPGRPEVEERERWVVVVPEAGLEPFLPRVTMTVPALSAASTAVFLVTGPQKRRALGSLLEGGAVPAARVGADRVVVLADEAAAGE